MFSFVKKYYVLKKIVQKKVSKFLLNCWNLKFVYLKIIYNFLPQFLSDSYPSHDQLLNLINDKNRL